MSEKTYTREQVENGVRLALGYVSEKLGVPIAELGETCGLSKVKAEGFYSGAHGLDDQELLRAGTGVNRFLDAEKQDYEEAKERE